jgi:LEA14-like dessication related protein
MKLQAILKIPGYLLPGIFFLQSCSIQIPQAKEIRLSGGGISTQGKPQVTVGVVIENPNAFSIRLRKLQATATLNGRDAGILEVPQKLNIKRKSAQEYPVSASLNWSSGLEGALDLLKGKKPSVQVQLQGSVRYLLIFRKKLELSYP